MVNDYATPTVKVNVYMPIPQSEAEAAAMLPRRPLISLGLHSTFVEEVTRRGTKTRVVEYELLCEPLRLGMCLSKRIWARFKANPDVLVPQFDISTRDRPVVEEPVTDDDQKAYQLARERLMHQVDALPDPPPRPVFGERPEW